MQMEYMMNIIHKKIQVGTIKFVLYASTPAISENYINLYLFSSTSKNFQSEYACVKKGLFLFDL